MSIDIFPPSGLQIAPPLGLAQGGTGAMDAATARTNLGLGLTHGVQFDRLGLGVGVGAAGTLSTAGNVNVGGNVYKGDVAGNNVMGFYSTLQAAGGTNRYFVSHNGDAPSYFAGPMHINNVMGIQTAPQSVIGLVIAHHKATQYAMILTALDTNVGMQTIVFQAVSGEFIGNISTTATTTSYNTSSDARLKMDIEPLPDALQCVRLMRPVRFRWASTRERAHGFLAHELQPLVPEAVTGQSNALDDEGRIQPQSLDPSKLVVWTVGAIQELARRVEALEGVSL